MESQRNGTSSSVGSKRKPPLTDCTNTVHLRSPTNCSSSSSSSSVFKKPFPVSFQFLNSHQNHASSSKPDIYRDQSTSGSTTDAVKKSRLSTVQEGSSISAPARPLPKPSAVVGGFDGLVSSPVFVRRQPESRRKEKESPIDLSSTNSHSSNNVLIPLSSVRRSSISTSARPLARPSSDVGADDVLEPSPVYVQRQSGRRRKDKENPADDVLAPSPVYVQRQSGRKRKDKENPIDISSTKSHSSNNVLIPLSSVRRSSLSTPAHPVAKPSSDAGADDVLEPSPVYFGRRSGSKRKDKENPIDISSTKSHSSNKVLIPLSAVRRSSISTPARPPARPSSDVGVDDVCAPSPVYVRRQSGSKRKDKEKAVDMQATKIHSSSRDKMKKDGGIAPSKSSGTPSREAKKVADAVDLTLPKEFIEKQKAYFAEIDAFELSEEEVTSADELE